MQVWTNGQRAPYRGAPVAFQVRTFARMKNDYHLGPLFTDSDGVLSVARQELELLVSAELSSGLMDYVGLETAFSFVEIVHYSSADITRMIRSRETDWTQLLSGEAELYGSLPALLQKLRGAGNGAFLPAEIQGRIRDEWTDPTRHAEYVYTVVRAQSA